MPERSQQLLDDPTGEPRTRTGTPVDGKGKRKLDTPMSGSTLPQKRKRKVVEKEREREREVVPVRPAPAVSNKVRPVPFFVNTVLRLYTETKARNGSGFDTLFI